MVSTGREICCQWLDIKYLWDLSYVTFSRARQVPLKLPRLLGSIENRKTFYTIPIEEDFSPGTFISYEFVTSAGKFLLTLMNWPSGETSVRSQVCQWYCVANKNSKVTSESIVEMWEHVDYTMGKHTQRPCHHTAQISYWFRPAKSRFHWYPTPRTFPLYQSQTYQSEDSHPYLDKLLPPTHTHPYKEH